MTRTTLLALAAATLLAGACASPNLTMGPEWARYVGSTYRHRDIVASAAETGPVETARSVAPAPTDRDVLVTPPTTPVAPPAMPALAPTRDTRDVTVTTNKGTRTVRSVPIPPAEAGLVASAPQPLTNAPAPAPRPPESVVADPQPVPAPAVKTAEQDQESSSPPAARRFVRLKITGMTSPESDPMEVRRQLRAADGVKEVVLSFKTRTAIVVVDKAVSEQELIASLAAPYAAETMN